MDAVNLKEARKRLGELVRAAERGESVVLARRGKKVARIEAIAAANGKRLPDLSDFRASVEAKGKALSHTVIEGRAQERH
jgi:prevent-host-death family protein